MLEVQPAYTTILADTVERGDSLDEEAMQNPEADVDYSMSAAELARAAAQILAIQK